MRDRERQAAEYAAHLGEEARRRQEQLAKDYFVCCGEHKQDGHHEACPKRPPDEPPIVHPDQGALL